MAASVLRDALVITEAGSVHVSDVTDVPEQGRAQGDHPTADPGA
jgi:hypothetical protein